MYVAAFRYLRDKLNISIKTATIDMEIAPRNANEIIFKGIQIQACLFHTNQVNMC